MNPLDSPIKVARFLVSLGYDDADVKRTILGDWPDTDADEHIRIARQEQAVNRDQLRDELDRIAIRKEHEV